MKKYVLLSMVFFTVILIAVFIFAWDTSPTNVVILPKAIKAPASYGGNWVTSVFIHDLQGNADIWVEVYYPGGGAAKRGPFHILDNTGKGPSIYTVYDILGWLEREFDPGFDYDGKVVCLRFYAYYGFFPRDIRVTARTFHSDDYAEVYYGYPANSGNSAASGRVTQIVGLKQSSSFRSSASFFNNSSSGTNVTFKLIGKRSAPCGFVIWLPPNPNPRVGIEEVEWGSFTKYFGGYDYLSFNPFNEAGVTKTFTCHIPFTYTATYDYDCYLQVEVTSGTGTIFGYGSVAFNTTNDPATIPMVQKD